MRAGPISASSYTAPPGDSGAFSYADQTGRQLIDGARGENWAADLGNGNSYEWIGWQFGSPLITFSFDARVEITKVTIGLQREERFAPALLPSVVKIGSSEFPLTGTELADGTWGDLAFSGSWSGSTLAIQLIDNGVVRDHNGTALDDWIFADEISFEGRLLDPPTTVPESAHSGLMMLAGFGVSICAYRRSRR